jgi:hypothetical protein
LPTFIGVSGQPNAGTLPNAGHAVQIGDTLTVAEIPLFTGFAKKHHVFDRTLLTPYKKRISFLVARDPDAAAAQQESATTRRKDEAPRFLPPSGLSARHDTTKHAVFRDKERPR